ncbi:DUF3617 family protein [Sphingomonas sp. LB-2]|uniref:DUF3617 family protein n=1 Tax=Sphingomonas caeni TaxID=2984949 RepID=UPI00222FA00A|nr:DUF3617 family protein [Sphingomonas caeni]MCW3846164.1 DUF3617 family protein [Sphingomonas caeni]
MRYHLPAMLLTAGLLAGCGPMTDNPANAPRLGQWQKESKLLTLIANDVWVDRQDAPFSLPPDSTEIKDCIEPTLKSGREINRDMLANSEKLCHLETFDEKGGNLTSTGTCGPSDKMGMEISGTVEFEGHEREESADAKVAVNMNVKDKSGATERVRVAYQTKWTRLGDCKR